MSVLRGAALGGARVDTLARFPILEVTTLPNYYPPAQIQYYHVPDSRFDPNPVKAMSLEYCFRIGRPSKPLATQPMQHIFACQSW